MLNLKNKIYLFINQIQYKLQKTAKYFEKNMFMMFRSRLCYCLMFIAAKNYLDFQELCDFHVIQYSIIKVILDFLVLSYIYIAFKLPEF